MATNAKTPADGNYILIVESDPELRCMLVEAVTMITSYQTVIAADVYQAAAIVEKSKPALLVLGYNLLLYRPTWEGTIDLGDYLDNPKLHPQCIDAISLYDLLRTCKNREDMPAIILTFSCYDYLEAKRRGIAHCRDFSFEKFSQLIEESLKIQEPLIELMAA